MHPGIDDAPSVVKIMQELAFWQTTSKLLSTPVISQLLSASTTGCYVLLLQMETGVLAQSLREHGTPPPQKLNPPQDEA